MRSAVRGGIVLGVEELCDAVLSKSDRRATMKSGQLRAMLAAVAVLALSATTAHAGEPLPGARWTEEHIDTDVGRLHADVFRPTGLASDEKTPVLLLISPYHNNANLPRDPYGTVYVPAASKPRILGRYRPFYTGGIARGYTIVQVDLPGWGASGGCADDLGPRERGGAIAAVRWAATQPWSIGRVGTFGGSYEGWSQVAAMTGRTEGHAAAVVFAPMVDAYEQNHTNGISHYLGLVERGRNVAMTSGGLNPAPLGSSQEEHLGATIGAVEQPGCSASRVARAHDTDPDAEVWRERRLSGRLGGTIVPTFLQAGFHDINVGMAQFPLLWSQLDGPRRLWAGQIDHREPNGLEAVTGRGGDIYSNALRWLDRYVKGVDNGIEDEPAVEVEEGSAGAWRNEAAWPPADARMASMQVLGGEFRDLMGNKAQPGDGPAELCEFSDARETRCYHPPLGYGQGAWSISQPLAEDLHLAGLPRLDVDVSADLPNGSLVALLYDIDPAGEATVLTRGAHLVNGTRSLSFDLYPQDWHLEAGHRLGLLLTGSDGEIFVSRNGGAKLTVTSGELHLPVIDRTAQGTLPTSHANTILARRATFPVPEETIVGRQVELR